MAEEVGATVTGATQVFTATVDGLVPAPVTATGTKVLYDDGTWAVAGGGSAITSLTGGVTATGPGAAAATVVTNANLTGPVTSVGNATTITNDAVTNAMLSNVATQTIKGRTTAGAGDPEDLSATQATAILNNFTGDSGSGGLKGLVPAPNSGDAALGKFLNADGTWGLLGDLTQASFSTEDFLGGALGTYATASAGTGAQVAQAGTLISTNRWGIVATSTGTTTTGRGGATAGFLKLGDGALVYQSDIYFPDLSTVTEEYIHFHGIADNGTVSTEPTEGFWFEYDRLTSTNWRVKNANGTTTTSSTTSTAVAEDTWVNLKAVIAADNSEIEFFINGVSVATHTTNLSTGAGNVRPFFKTVKSAGTTARAVHVDYTYYTCKFNSPR